MIGYHDILSMACLYKHTLGSLLQYFGNGAQDELAGQTI